MSAVTYEPQPLLTTEQVAHRLALSANTVRTLCDSGQLPHLRIGSGKKKEYRVDPADLDAYIEQARVKPEVPEPKPGRGQRKAIPIGSQGGGGRGQGFSLLRAAGYRG